MTDLAVLMTDYWPWLAGALLVLLALILLTSRRGQRIELTRDEDVRPTLAREAVPVTPPAPVLNIDAGNDLTRVKGLGPRLAALLAERGITSTAQLAALSPDAAEKLDASLGSFAGRLARDRFVEQARFLASGDLDGFRKEFGALDGEPR